MISPVNLQSSKAFGSFVKPNAKKPNVEETKPTLLKSMGMVALGATFTSMGIDVFTSIYNQMVEGKKAVPMKNMLKNAGIWIGVALTGFGLIKLFEKGGGVE